jgi:ParB family chromosome partitioning protein
MAGTKKGGLGRGLDALFADSVPVSRAAEAQISAATGAAPSENKDDGAESVKYISIHDVRPNANQPRKTFDEEKIAELAASIRENGIIQPLIVRKKGKTYEIVAGERRWRASVKAELKEVPCIVRELDDEQNMLLAIVENMQREDLNPLEEAMAYRALKEEYDMTQEELSERIGKSRSAIANSIRLLDLPDPILTMVAARELSAGHARTLLGVKDRENMILLAQIAAEQDLSVRQLEEQVKKINRAKKPEKEDVEEDVPFVDYFREMELKIQRQLGRKAKIQDKGKKKTLTLFYEDNEDLDELLKVICGSDFLDEV